jgi:uncharacterized protein (DUF342 family)
MEARLSLEPVAGAKGELTANMLSEALEKAGVIRGISISALKLIVEDWNANPRAFETGPVAVGSEPVPENSGPIRMQIKYLATATDIQKASERKFAWEIASLVSKVQRVDPGTVIARRTGGSAPLLGYTVCGTPVVPPEPSPDESADMGKICESNNVFYAGNIFTAAATGIAFMDSNDMPGVIPIDFDGSVEIEIARDAMSAELIAYPAGERGEMPTEEFIVNLIDRKKITFGIDEEGLKYFIKELSCITSRASFIVAEGLKPIKGNDGRIEFCFNTDSSPTPSINQDGSVDYKNINIVTAVGTGATLAKLHPPQSGMPGMDIFGRPLPALKGNPVMLPVGSNTAIPKDDQTTLISVIDGIPNYDGSAVNVSEGYAIPGDVDYSTGNIHYDNTVTVKGDVKSGFDVTCGGDLQVNGLIEDCKITTNGNVLCKYGFVGTGKGIIEAKGDVNLLYIKNQTIISEGSVNIAKESINSNIIAHKSINVYGQRLSVAGGKLISMGAIVVKAVGNISGIQTTLQIDPDPLLTKELENTQASYEQHSENINKIAQTLKNIPPDKRNDKELVFKLKSTIDKLKQQQLDLENKMRIITALIDKYENTFIRVDRMAYPGTTFQFGPKKQMSLTLTDMMTGGRTVKVVGGEVKIV